MENRRSVATSGGLLVRNRRMVRLVCDTAGAVQAVERLRAVTPLGQTCSAGLATRDGRETSDEISTRADAALYAAKRAGRDRIVVADAAVADPA